MAKARQTWIVKRRARCDRLAKGRSEQRTGTGFLSRKFAIWAALPLALAPAAAHAQDGGEALPPSESDAALQPESDEVVEFSAEEVTYESESDVVVASGAVRM